MAAMRIGLDGEGGNTDMAEVMSTSDIYKSKKIYFTLDIDPQVAQPSQSTVALSSAASTFVY